MSGRHVIIVGAGPGGLSSAMLLASAGMRVTVLERQQHVGGRTSALKLGPFTFDMGPTFFLYPKVLEEIFQACGRDLHEEVDMVRLDPQYHLIFQSGGDIRATPDLERMRAELARINPNDADALDAYLKDNRRKFAAFTPVLQQPFSTWRDFLNPSVLASLPMLRPGTSVDRDLRRFFKDPRSRLAFSFQSKYLGMSPMRCPSLFTILAFLEYEYGVYHPIGGCNRVMHVMADIAKDMGVDIRLGEQVEEVLLDGRQMTGVRTSDNTYEADALVINADFADAMTRLVPDHIRRRWTNRRIEKKLFSCSTFMMYLGLDGTCPELEHHTIFLPHDYEKNLEEIERQHVLSDNPSLYVQNPCRTDATLAPKGSAALYCLAPVSHEHPNIDWDTQKPLFRKRIIDRLQEMGVNDVEQRIRTEKVITPKDWRTDMRVYRGATFNLAHNFSQMLHRRPRNRFEDLDGVYLVGGGTHPGSGLPVIFESARISSRLVAEDLGLSIATLQTPVRSKPSAPQPVLQPV